jgi:hypothetical protein
MDATMATRITVALEDNLEGGQVAETVQLGIGGIYYGIDLNASNAATFRRQLAPTSNTPAGLAETKAAAGRTASSRARNAEIGAWAKEQGIALSDRRRIPGDIVWQHQVATGGR